MQKMLKRKQRTLKVMHKKNFQMLNHLLALFNHFLKKFKKQLKMLKLSSMLLQPLVHPMNRNRLLKELGLQMIVVKAIWKQQNSPRLIQKHNLHHLKLTLEKLITMLMMHNYSNLKQLNLSLKLRDSLKLLLK